MLRSVASEAVSAAAQEDGGTAGAAGAGLTSSGTSPSVGTGKPPVVQAREGGGGSRRGRWQRITGSEGQEA